MKRLFLILISITLAGCTTTRVKQDNTPAPQLDANTGILFGSFSRDHRSFEYYSQYFYFKNANSKKEYMIESNSQNFLYGDAPVDFESIDNKGVLFTFTLPAGKYYFNNYRIYHSTGMYQSDWSSKKDFSIPFEVVAGKANYVGDIRLIPRIGKNMFGVPIPVGGTWEIRNNKIQDISKFVAKFPNIEWSGNLTTVPSIQEIETPLVTLLSSK